MIAELRQLGLTDGEARVYTALLKTGPSTVGPIVKESGVAYSNIYEILDRLIKKGLITFILKEKTKYFQITNPARLQDFVEEKAREQKQQEEIVRRIIPQLSRIQKEKVQEAEIFVGFAGLKSAYDTMLSAARKGEEFLYFYDPKNSSEEIDRFYLRNMHRFRNTKIMLKGISPEQYQKNASHKETRWNKMQYVTFPVPGTIDIFQDKVLLISWKNTTGILITSEELAENYRAYFYSVWNTGKKKK